MNEPVTLDRFVNRRFSKFEMTRHFLEDSIATIEFHMENARVDDNQKTAQAFSDLLVKMRRMLSDLQTRPVAS